MTTEQKDQKKTAKKGDDSDAQPKSQAKSSKDESTSPNPRRATVKSSKISRRPRPTRVMVDRAIRAEPRNPAISRKGISLGHRPKATRSHRGRAQE